ncbi:MAG: hypothetical protein V1664_02895 [Candidatus Uhrbacteria bacterium]
MVSRESMTDISGVNPDQTPTAEQPRNTETSRETEPKIVLHFFRHSEKEKALGRPDERVPITPCGRHLAKDKAEATNFSQAVAFASPRDRAKHTALLRMIGGHDEITGEEELEELLKKTELPVGSKIAVDKSLDFNYDSRLGVIIEEAYERGEHLKFLIEQSDTLAANFKDETTSTYQRNAAKIAKKILRYAKILPRWKQILEDDSTKKYSDTLERFFGSHQGVTESFLAKVIEMTEGADRRDEFVAALGNQGFDYVEGFNVEINQNEPIIHLSYSRPQPGGDSFVFNQALTRSQLESIASLK